MSERTTINPPELNQALDATANNFVGQCLTDLEELGADKSMTIIVRRSHYAMLDEIKRKLGGK